MSERFGRQQGRGRRFRQVGLALAAAAMLGACGHMMSMLHGGPERPAEDEFGLGPRVSTSGMFSVTLQPAAPLAKRKLQKIRVEVVDATGARVDGADISVDGGMPQHGHGLPTRPRVTRRLGAGMYEIDGVRFNMGGWWEFKLAIATDAGADSVTFNLDL